MTKTGITRTLNYLEDFGIFRKIYDSGYCRKYRYIDKDKNVCMDIVVFCNSDIIDFRIKYMNIDYMGIIQKRYCDFRNMKEFRYFISDIIQKHIIDCEYA